MKTVYSDDHNLHVGLLDPRGESWRESAETPARANNIVDAIRENDFGAVVPPDEFDDSAYLRLHAPDYVEFLRTVWDEWVAAGAAGMNVRPDTFVGAGMRHVATRSIIGKVGRYSFDSTSPMVAGSWKAIRSSANVALTGARIVRDGDSQAFALCRPPGHHATADYCGGYCFLNNNALAAQSFLDAGASRVAIVDVDYHHGNGTQTLFYGRNDVLTISLHADPALEYPYFLGYEDEPGEGKGHGFNINYPLPFGTDWVRYREALGSVLAHVGRFAPDALVVALGLDTFAGDPTTYFEVASDDFTLMGETLGALGLPTLVVLEGGYSVDWIGINTVNFLAGLQSAAPR